MTSVKIELYDFDVHGARGPDHEAVGWKVTYWVDGKRLDGSLWVDLPTGRTDITDGIEKAIEDNARLRALIKAQEFGNHEETASGAGDFCPWCRHDGPHAADCPAFTPEGEVR